jgi:transposase
MQTQIELCEKQIENVLKLFMQNQTSVEQSVNSAVKPKTKNQPKFNTRSYLKNIHQVDVIDIYGLSEISALEILSETGTDLTKWPNEKKFVKWLNLCPNNKITGGKLISSQLMKKKPNAAAQAFRMAANSLKQSKHWLGDYFRRTRAKGGQKYAIVATARKLAIIYYKMVRFKEPFTPFDMDKYNKKYRQAKIANLEKLLKKLKIAA